MDLANNQITELSGLLSVEERARAQKLKIPEKHNQFVITRGRLRQILGNCLNTDPDVFDFDYELHGKPMLGERWGGCGLRFNVSHSHVLALIAVALEHPIGIDIEKIQHDRDHAALAKRFFTAREQADLLALPAGERTRAFYGCWTRKEAFVKAVGDGITWGLDTFDVSVHPDVIQPSLHIHGSNAKDRIWSVFNLPMEDDYMAALVVAGNDIRVRCYKGPE